MKQCEFCRRMISDTAKFCEHCGAPVGKRKFLSEQHYLSWREMRDETRTITGSVEKKPETPDTSTVGTARTENRPAGNKKKKWLPLIAGIALAAIALGAVIGIGALGGGEQAQMEAKPQTTAEATEPESSTTNTASVSNEAPEEPDVSYGGDYTVTVITKALDSDYWHTVQAGAINKGNELGVTVNVLGPNNEQDTQGEMNQILDAVANGTDGLVIAPNDPNSLASTISDAHSMGIPTVIIDSPCPDPEAFDVFVGTDNYAAGKALGEFVGNDQKGAKAVVIRGLAGSNTHDDRTNGITEGLEAAGGTVLSAQPADSDQAKAVTVAENMIQSYGDELNAIITTGDEMALGAYQAIAAAGKQDQIRLYTIGGGLSSLESMINGEIYADCAQKPYEMGEKGVEIAVDLLKGVAVEDIEGIDGTTVDTGYEIITRDTAVAYYDSLQEKMSRAGF